jgi:penicillin amidase
VVGFATVLDLADGGDDVIARDLVARNAGPQSAAVWYSLTDPAYDRPTMGGTPLALPPLARPGSLHAPAPTAFVPREGELGSNIWAVGAARSTVGRALLANDPHLRRTMPGIWYLVDLAAPGLHVAGATLAGVPGVILGHNEHLAWGATNGYAAAARVYRETFTTVDGDAYRAGAQTVRARVRDETFHVRFGADQHRRYLSTRHGFVVEASGVERHAVQWEPFERPIPPVRAFWELDRARSIEDGVRALAGYPGPTQNFMLADDTGRVAYAMAGHVPDGAPWGLRALDGAAIAPAPLQPIPFALLPHLAPTRDGPAINANNLPYPSGYPYRIAPTFAPPYRAAEIARALGTEQRFDVETFRQVQADTSSPAEAELARRTLAALRKTGADRDADLAPAVAALQSFDGRFTTESRGATVVQRVRQSAVADLVAMHLPPTAARAYLSDGPGFETLMRALRERPAGWFPHDDPDRFLVDEVRTVVKHYGRDKVAAPYGEAYAVFAPHPLSGLGFTFWNGPLVAGSGGSYAPAVQGPVLGQSFRAIWEVGAWDVGGIDIPLGESGEPGSPHYRDLAARWPRHELTPLPFSDAAVASATRATLELRR